MRQGDKKPHVNKKKSKGCWLEADDNGRVVKIIVRNDGWTTAFPSGACDDYWDWAPNAVSQVDGTPKDDKATDDEWSRI